VATIVAMPDHHPDELCAAMAADQFGVISRAQLLATGLRQNAINHRLGRKRLELWLPGAYAVGGTPRSWNSHLMSAICWGGDGCAASHRAAARKWEFDGFRHAPIEISTTRWKHCSDLKLCDGTPVIVHRVDNRMLSEIVTVAGHPVTSVRRTIIDIAGRRHPRTESILDSALRRELSTVGQLWLLLEQEWMRGRRGVRIMRDLLAERTAGRAPTDSDLEIMLRNLIDAAKLPAPVHQFPVELPDAVIHIDLAYPRAKLAIEVDSYSWHMDRKTFELDRRRDNELRALGWTVLRFTWAMIRFEPERVIDLIRGALAECASEPV
jgi:very-short-patch-repair endonuclease